MKQVFILCFVLLSVIHAAETPSYMAIGGGRPFGLINNTYDATVSGHDAGLAVLKAGIGYEIDDKGVEKGGGGSFTLEYSKYLSPFGRSGYWGILGGYSYHGTKENIGRIMADDDELELRVKGKLHEIKLVPNILLSVSETSDWAVMIGVGGQFSIDKSYSQAFINGSQSSFLSISDEDFGNSGVGFIAQGALPYTGESGGGVSIESSVTKRNVYIGILMHLISF